MLEIQKKLAIVGTVVTGGYNLMLAVRRTAKEGKLSLIKTINYDRWREYKFEDPESTTTFEDCVDVKLDEVGRLTLEIWNGENLRGHPTNRRVSFEFEGEWWRIEVLVKVVDAYFKNHCLEELKRREKEERERQAALIGSELIEKFDSNNKVVGVIEFLNKKNNS